MDKFYKVIMDYGYENETICNTTAIVQASNPDEALEKVKSGLNEYFKGCKSFVSDEEFKVLEIEPKNGILYSDAGDVRENLYCYEDENEDFNGTTLIKETEVRKVGFDYRNPHPFKFVR